MEKQEANISDFTVAFYFKLDEISFKKFLKQQLVH
jgi:hypothetical protein